MCIRDSINTGGFFYGPGWGEGHKKLNCSLIVTDLPDYGRFVAEHRPPNVFVAQTTPMDENGKFQISLCMMWEPETFAAVMAQPDHRIILEVNPQQVHVKGGLEIDINDVSCLYEVDEPLAEIPAMQATEVEDTIGGLVSDCLLYTSIGDKSSAAGLTFCPARVIFLINKALTGNRPQLPEGRERLIWCKSR